MTEEDIMYMVNEGHEQGVLEASEAEMITNIFEFDDKVAADIMTHRTAVIALDGEMTLKEALDFVVKEANYSRFPVYSEDIDNIIGILHMRDMLHYTDSKDHLNTSIAKIKGLLRSPHFIPETKNINALFKEMQSQKIHIELVVDEYGQLAGIVTMRTFSRRSSEISSTSTTRKSRISYPGRTVHMSSRVSPFWTTWKRRSEWNLIRKIRTILIP